MIKSEVRESPRAKRLQRHIINVWKDHNLRIWMNESFLIDPSNFHLKLDLLLFFLVLTKFLFFYFKIISFHGSAMLIFSCKKCSSLSKSRNNKFGRWKFNAEAKGCLRNGNFLLINNLNQFFTFLSNRL